MTTKNILMAAVSLSFLAMPVMPANALTPASEDGWAHFSECLGVMFSDPTTHEAECSPSNNALILQTITSTGSSPCTYDVSMLPYGTSFKIAAVCEEEPDLEEDSSEL